MERWREWDSYKFAEALRIVELSRRRSGGHMTRRDFDNITAGDLSCVLNIRREEALGFLNSSVFKPEAIPASRWTDKIGTEIQLGEEYDRQAKKMAHIFAPILNLSEGAYMASLPSFPDRPEPFENARLRPLIVEGNRVHWRKQLELSGIKTTFGRVRIRDYEWNSPRFVTPENPYTTWVSVNGFPGTGHRFGTILEAISYWCAFPEIAKGGLFSLQGSVAIRWTTVPPGNTIKEFGGENPLYLDCSEYSFPPELCCYPRKESMRQTLYSTRDIRT